MNESIDRMESRISAGIYDDVDSEAAIKDFVAANGFIVGGAAFSKIRTKLYSEMHKAEIRAAWKFIRENI